MSNVRFLVLLVTFTFVFTTIANQVSGLVIKSRSEWGARQSKQPLDPLAINPPPYVIVHHSAGPSCFTESDCMARVRSIQNYHINNNGWNDIGYNFLIGEDGNIYEGRGWGKWGAHAPNYNSKSIGICMLGEFSGVLPNHAAIKAIKNLITFGVLSGYIKTDYKLLGHRQVRQTTCPGNALYGDLQTWTNWSPSP